MKRVLMALLVLGTAVSAHAVPIPFQFAGGSISATGALALSSYSPNSGSALLDDGQSANFNFGTVSVLGLGAGNLTVNVNFLSPITGGVGVSGPYSVIALVVFNNGQWTGGSTPFSYSYMGNVGNALLTMNPIDKTTLLRLPSFDFRGSITNLGSQAVPEPGALVLFGIGMSLLAGVGVMRRRRAKA